MEKLKIIKDILILICYLFAKTVYSVLLSCVISFLALACTLLIPFISRENGFLVVIGLSDIIAGTNIFQKPQENTDEKT